MPLDSATTASVSDPGGPLRSDKSAKRLELISRLRARGIGNHVALPQLVVCGDQSAGKSSVLEGITGIPFPRQDGLCTTFATEIILQHQPGETVVKASIIPNELRSFEDKLKLSSFDEQKPLDTLPDTIARAGELMGVRKTGACAVGPAFVSDVLRIEVRGPHGVHLSVVDLPGLISVASEEQTNEDVRTVHQLVDKYVADQRTIVLAVVQAGNDIANQNIIQKSKKFDRAGERTVGIITKPDLINRYTEARIALLASNKDTTKLKLGFFLVKNPAPHEINEGVSFEQRFENEKRYFRSPPWADQALLRERTGTPALRDFLQTLLERHIERELPKVKAEIKAQLQKTEQDITDLGQTRSDPSGMRIYLTRLAMSFHSLVTSAINGTYDDSGASFFAGDRSHSRRLRATIQKTNGEYSDKMRERGQKRKAVAATPEPDARTGDPARDPDKSEECIKVSDKEMKAWVHSVYENARGKELPGTFNYVLLAELFREQALPWLPIAEEHLQRIHETIWEVITSILAHVVLDEKVSDALNGLIGSHLEQNLIDAHDELKKIWGDEQHQPITYNHYFTDNLQKSRQARSQRAIHGAAQLSLDKRDKNHDTKLDVNHLISLLQPVINVDMDDQACVEALDSLNSYYKVARKVFVDNVCRQVIERHLIRKLPNLFSPDLVAEMDDDELERIAAETPSLGERRRQLQALREDLAVSLAELTAAPQK